MQSRVFMAAAAAALLTATLAQAAPWSFDPERYLASLSDEARCSASMARADLAHEPETTGAVAAQPAENDPALPDAGDDDL